MGHSWLSDCWESKLSAVHRTQVYGSRGVKLQSQIPPQPPPPLLHSSLPAPLLPLSPTSRHYLPQAARNESNTSQIGAGRGNQFSELLVCPETDLREWSSVTARATASPPLLWWLVRGAASITRRQDYEFENNLIGVLLLLGASPASLVLTVIRVARVKTTQSPVSQVSQVPELRWLRTPRIVYTSFVDLKLRKS